MDIHNNPLLNHGELSSASSTQSGSPTFTKPWTTTSYPILLLAQPMCMSFKLWLLKFPIILHFDFWILLRIVPSLHPMLYQRWSASVSLIFSNSFVDKSSWFKGSGIKLIIHECVKGRNNFMAIFMELCKIYKYSLKSLLQSVFDSLWHTQAHFFFGHPFRINVLCNCCYSTLTTSGQQRPNF